MEYIYNRSEMQEVQGIWIIIAGKTSAIAITSDDIKYHLIVTTIGLGNFIYDKIYKMGGKEIKYTIKKIYKR